MPSSLKVVEQEAKSQALQVLNKYGSIVVKDQKSYDKAVNARAAMKQFIDGVTTLFEPMRQTAYAAWKQVTATRDSVIAPVEEALKEQNKQLSAFVEEQEEEQKRLEEEELERQRVKAEKKRQREVAAAKKKGYDPEAIKALEKAPLEVGPIEVVSTYVKSDELTQKKLWRCEVTNKLALVKFVAKNPHFIHLLDANQSELNNLARRQQKALNIPGVKAIGETTVASVGKRSNF